MKNEVLYKYAQKQDGSLISITDAKDGEKYYCPGCNNEFIFRHGQIRQYHFAHKDPSPNCTNEGYLHKTFKNYLVLLIKQRIEKNEQLQIKFVCNFCKTNHLGNIIKNIAYPIEELVLEDCRPDISLLTKENELAAIIEIVVTHEPESNVLNYCKNKAVVLIVIKLETLNDLDNIDYKIENPSYVVLPKIELCPHNKQQTGMHPNPLIYRPIAERGPRIDRIEAKQRGKLYRNNTSKYQKRKR
jgi:hypothetical protein